MSTKTRLVDEERAVVSIAEAKRIIKKIAARAIKTGSIETIEMEGGPGIGKSQIVSAIAKELGVKETDIRVGQMADASDMVMKLPNAEHTSIHEIVLSRFPKEPNNVIRLDEFRHGAEDVRRGCYQLLQDKCLGSYNVPPGTIMVAISNEAADAMTEDLEGPLFDRFTYRMKVVADFKDWENYITTKGYNNGPIVTSFLKYHQDSFILKPENGRVLMTPRRWEQVMVNLEDLDLVKTIMPPATYIVFEQFVKKVDMFKNVEQYISGKLRMPDDIGDQWAVYAAIMSNLQIEAKYEDKCFDVFEEKMHGMDPDIQANTILDTIRFYLTKKKASLSDVLIKLPAAKKTVLNSLIGKYKYAASGVLQSE